MNGGDRLRSRVKALFATSIVLLLLGGTCLVVEALFYGDIDENGFIQDSLFLPLGIAASLLGGAGLLLSLFLRRGKKIGRHET